MLKYPGRMFQAPLTADKGFDTGPKMGRFRWIGENPVTKDNSPEARLWAVLPIPHSLLFRSFPDFGQGFA